MTCAYPERSQLFVVVVAHSPYMAQVADIPDLHGRQRRGLQKRGIHQKLQYKVAVLYAHHKAKPSAAIAAQICADFMHVLNKGAVPTTSDAEFVENGERLPGGSEVAREKTLPFDLKDRGDRTPYARSPIKQWWRRRDRCAAQFQGARAFKNVQDFERTTGVSLLDCSPPAMEGKWLCDGYGNRPARVAEDNSFRPQDESWAPGVRDFCLFVASKMLKPGNAGNYNQGRWGPTEYIHAFYPDSAFAATVPEVSTWSGSDESHVFKGKYNRTDDDELIRRKKLCVCDPCFAGQYQHCQSNAEDGGLWYGEIERKTLVATAARVVATTRSANTFEELLRWKIFHKPSTFRHVDNVVAIRVHTKERTKTEEAYYLAKVTGPMVKLTSGGMYEGNWYEKGFYVAPMTWYHYRGTIEVRGKPIGDRQYTLGTASSDKCTMQLNGVVTGADNFCRFAKTKKVKGRDKVFVLSAESHDCIMTQGNLSS